MKGLKIGFVKRVTEKLIKGQAVLDGKGRTIPTPNIKVYSNRDYEFRIGKFYRTGNGDIYIGFRYERRW